MSTLSTSRSSSASSSASSQSSTPTPTPSTSSSSSLNNLPVRPAANPNAPSVPVSNSASNINVTSAPPQAPTPLTPVQPSFTLMTPTPPPSSSRPLPESPSDNKHNRKWRASPLKSELTNVRNQQEQLQAHDQSSQAHIEEHFSVTSEISPPPTAAASNPSPTTPAAVTAACSTNTPNPLQTSNVYINGLPPHFKAEQLYALTAQFGVVLSCRTFTRQLAECPSGYGFVLFDNVAAAQQCIDVLRSHHNLHPTFAKQAHKITRTPIMGTLASNSSPVNSTMLGINMNSTTANISSAIHSSSSVPSNVNTGALGNNCGATYGTFSTTAMTSAYVPGPHNTVLGGHGMGGAAAGISRYCSDGHAQIDGDGEDRNGEGMDIYIEGLPPTLTSSTLSALLAPYVPLAHRFFADTRPLAPSSEGATETGGTVGAGGKGGGKGGSGRTGRLVVFVRLSSRAAAHDVRAKLHGRTIRGYSARLRVSFADDLDTEHEQNVELGPGNEPEYGFGFEGGGVGVHGADDGGRFDAYGVANGGAYCNADGCQATNMYGYYDAYSGTCTANGHPNSALNTNVATRQKTNQQPIVSGLPGPANEEYCDPFYDGFEGAGNALRYGVGDGEWNGSLGGSGIGNLTYGQRQLHSQGQGHGLGMGNGAGLGSIEQVQQLLQVRNQLQLQNQLLGASPMSRYSDHLDADALPPRPRAHHYTDSPSPSPHAQTINSANGISTLSGGGMHTNTGPTVNTLSTLSPHTPLQTSNAPLASLIPHTNTSALHTQAIPAPLQPISVTLHELQLQLESLRPLLAAYNQGQGQQMMQGQGMSVGTGLSGGGLGGAVVSAPAMNANANTNSGGYAGLGSNVTHGTFNANATARTNTTLTPLALRPRSLSTAHVPTHSSGSGSTFGNAVGTLGGSATALNPRAQTYAHPNAHVGHSQSTNVSAGSNANAVGNSSSNSSNSNSTSTNAISAHSNANTGGGKHNVPPATLSASSNVSTTQPVSTSPTSKTTVSTLSPVSHLHCHSPAPPSNLAPTPNSGAHTRAQTSAEPAPSTRSRAHTTTGHGFGHGRGGLETLALGGPGGTGTTGLGMGLGAPLFPHPQTHRNGP